jgi:hypothetical protein
MTLSVTEFRQQRKVLMLKLHRALGEKNKERITRLTKLINDLDYSYVSK